MRRYIVLLLITGILWAQTDFDTLILKSGIKYFGEYSKIEEEIVYFKPQNAFAFQPISIKQIQTLKLKDGHFIIGDILTYEEYQKKLIIIEDGKNILTYEEYQKENQKGNKVFFLFCSIIAVVIIVFIVKNFSIDMSGGGDTNGGDTGTYVFP